MPSGSGEGLPPGGLDLTHLPASGPLVVAVSGGADSMALWGLLAEEDRWQLIIWHLDHGIRPEAGRDAELIQSSPLPGERRCERADVPDLARTWKCGLEEAGRRVRYQRLAEVAAVVGTSVVVTAHHQDDQAETILLNLLRGCHGLVGMPARRELAPGIQLVRPALGIPRAALRAWAQQHGIRWHEDATNTDLTYARNRIRHAVLPTFSAVPGFTATLVAAVRTSEPPLRSWLRARSLPASRAIMARLAALGIGQRTTLAGRIITRTGTGWHDAPEHPRPEPAPRWRPARAAEVAEMHQAIVLAQVDPPLIWRHPRPGERWRPLGSPGSQTLFHSLAARRIPARARAGAWVLADRQGPVWVAGCTIAERCRVLPGQDPATCIVVECADPGSADG